MRGDIIKGKTLEDALSEGIVRPKACQVSEMLASDVACLVMCHARILSFLFLGILQCPSVN